MVFSISGIKSNINFPASSVILTLLLARLTISSAATLYDVGFNYFFRGSEGQLEDLIYYQGHSSPGIYARSFLEGYLHEEDLDNFKNSFLKKGFKNVIVLHTHNREEANTDEFTLPLKNAKGVWFSGGRQWRLADSYLNTKTHEAFKALLDRGGVIAGSSAGATIQGSYLARGDTKTNTIMMGDHEEGLSFLTNVAIDQHLLARNRQFDMFDILDNRPELLGIG